MEKAIVTIDWDLLKDISYSSELGKSLKNTLRKFDKEELFDELNNMIMYFTEKATKSVLKEENRIKSIHSCNLKYHKYFPTTPVEKAFNDILGIRIIIDDYSVFDEIKLPKCTKVADMRNGKAKDDGYRAIHVYYQLDHFHYPIEIQFVTAHDRQFNEWLHVYLYKYTSDLSVGVKLREMYELGLIQSKDQFREEMNRICVI